MTNENCYGSIGRFSDATALLRAIDACKEAGYQKMETFTPLPVPEAASKLGIKSRAVQFWAWGGAITGLIGGYLLEYYAAVISYPVNVGGRPLNSIPSFIQVTFEMTILTSALVTVFAMLILNGLPRLHHPIFESEEFLTASRDGFLLFIEAADPHFNTEQVQSLLEEAGALAVVEVPL